MYLAIGRIMEKTHALEILKKQKKVRVTSLKSCGLYGDSTFLAGVHRVKKGPLGLVIHFVITQPLVIS